MNSVPNLCRLLSKLGEARSVLDPGRATCYNLLEKGHCGTRYWRVDLQKEKRSKLIW